MEILRNLMYVATLFPYASIAFLVAGLSFYYSAKMLLKMERAERKRKPGVLNFSDIRKRLAHNQLPAHQIRYAARMRRSA
jgi:hypothetical protein